MSAESPFNACSQAGQAGTKKDAGLAGNSKSQILTKKEIYKFQHGDQYFGLDVRNFLFFKMNKITWEVIDAFPHHNQLTALYDSLQLKDAINSLKKNELITHTPPGVEPISDEHIPVTGVGLCICDPDEDTVMPMNVVRSSIELLIHKSSAGEDCHLVFITNDFEKFLTLIEDAIGFAKIQEKKYNKKITFSLRTEQFPLSSQGVRFLLSHDLGVEIVLTPERCRRHLDIFKGINDSDILDLQHIFKPIILKTIINLNLDSQRLSFLKEILKTLYKIGFKMVFLDILCPRCRGRWSASEINSRLMIHTMKQHPLEFTNDKTKDFKGIINIIPLIHAVMTSSKIRYGCRAGINYIAVSPGGEIYPCHNVMDSPRLKMGNVSGCLDRALKEKIAHHHVDNKKKCRACGVRYFCGGGPGPEVEGEHPVECEIRKKLAEFAMITHSKLDLMQKTWVICIDKQMKAVMPYRWSSVKKIKKDIKRRRLKVKGESMRPLVREGDEVMVRPLETGKVKVGDIVCFGKPVTCHRVIGKSRCNGRLYLLEKGDRQLESTKIPVDDISGKVVAIHKGERILNLDNKWGRLLNLIMAWLSLVTLKVGKLFSRRRITGQNGRNIETERASYFQ